MGQVSARVRLLVNSSFCVHEFRKLKYAVCKLGDWYVVDETRGKIEGYCSRSFFAFMDHYKVVYIIWTSKPVNYWIPTSSRNGFLKKKSEFLTDFSFWGRLRVTGPFMTWILKEQFSNLAPLNMPGISLFIGRFLLCSFWSISTKLVKELELAFVTWTFAE